MTKIIGVALLDVLRSYDKVYSYIVPVEAESMSLDQLVGRLVSVPFGLHDNLKLGVVMEASSVVDTTGYKLKRARSINLDVPALSSQALCAATYMRDRFYCSTGAALRCFLPSYITTKSVVKTVKVAVFASDNNDLDSLVKNYNIRSHGAIKALDALISYKEATVEQLKLSTGISAGMIKKLTSLGVITIEERVVDEIVEISKQEFQLPVSLLPEQIVAAKSICDAIDSNFHEIILLHGVTGSGKTEVYMEAIRHAIAQGMGALVIVPEIALTPQTQRRFERVFGGQVAVLHSAMSEATRRRTWMQVAKGEVRILVGPRSALFAPVNNLGLIVVDEQHDGSYRSETTPKYDAILMAEELSRLYNIPLVLGSATPSIDIYKRALDGEITLLSMAKRANNKPMPKVNVVDLRKDRGYPISDTLIDSIRENIRTSGKTMILLNRRGFATSVVCGDCGATLKCPSCGVRLNWHRQAKRVVCHYCGYTTAMPEKCYSCGSTKLVQRGAGIQFVEEYIKEKFPDVPLFRLDSDSVTYGNDREDILAAFRESKAGILLGTQMISKGHDFPDVTLVGILGIDSTLGSEGYLGPEQAFQIMMQTAGRAGRADLLGKVVIETSEPDNFCIKAVCNYDYNYFYRQEITMRERLGYPPYGQIASCVFVGPDDRATFDKCLSFKQDVLAKRLPDLLIAGPARPVVPKQSGKYRWKLILKRSNTVKPLHEDVISVVDKTEPKSQGLIHLSLDFNPDSVLN